MNIKNVKRKVSEERKNVRINLKITKSVSTWLKKEDISPQKLFDEAIKDLRK